MLRLLLPIALLSLAACGKRDPAPAPAPSVSAAPLPSAELRPPPRPSPTSDGSHDCAEHAFGYKGPTPSPAPLLLPGPPVVASRKAQRLELSPLGLSFLLPRPFDSRDAEVLTKPSELARVRVSHREWERDYATILNDILPFETIIAHVGEEHWRESGIYTDVKARIYAVQEPVPEAEAAILAAAMRAAEHFTCARPDPGAIGPMALTKRWSVVPSLAGDWKRIDVSTLLWYGDYGGDAHVDLRLRRVHRATLIVVFLYEHEKEAASKAFTGAIDAALSTRPTAPP